MKFQGKFEKILTPKNTNLSQLVLQDGVKVNDQIIKQGVYFLLGLDQACQFATLPPGAKLEIEADGLGIVPQRLTIGWSQAGAA